MDIKEWLKTWVPIIGRIAGICGVIIAAIAAYIVYTTREPRAKLTAKAYYENWRAPRVVTEDLTYLEGARSQFKSQDVNDQADLKTVWVLLDSEPNYHAHDIGEMHCMCSITITNEGGGPATNVIMDFPDANHVEFYRGGIPEKEAKKSTGKIFYQLEENLPQQEKCQVIVWTHCKPERKCGKRLNISCEQDTASICVRIPVRGYAKYMSYYPGWTIFLIVIMWVVIHAFVWFMRRRKKKPKPAILSAKTSRGT